MKKNISHFGFLLINKPVGWTSFDVCARLRGLLRTKKIGHTGTLDPFATGLLLIALGKATRLIPFFEKSKKIYETEIILGQTSETLDPESKIQTIKPLKGQEIPSKKIIQEMIEAKFLGKILQTPPKYSALKIKGKKMCDLARSGEAFEIKSRETYLHKCKIIEYKFPVVKLHLEVDAGFYVRSFARDLGESLYGSGMCLSLHRTSIGKLNLQEFPIFPASFLKKKTVSRPKQKTQITVEKKFLAENNLSTLNKPIKKVSEKFTSQKLEVLNFEGYFLDLEKILELPVIEIIPDRKDDFSQGRAFPFDFPDSINPQDLLLVKCSKKIIGVGRIDCGNLAPKICF